jgi:hypothetical protein
MVVARNALFVAAGHHRRAGCRFRRWRLPIAAGLHQSPGTGCRDRRHHCPTEITMKLPLLAVLTLAIIATPGAARDLDVLQPGDEALSCRALSSQMNTLLREQARERRRAQGGGGRGLLSALGRVAAPVLDTVVSETGGATMVAADGARQVLRSEDNAGTPAAASQPAAPSLVDQRLARLTGFHTAKGC